MHEGENLTQSAISVAFYIHCNRLNKIFNFVLVYIYRLGGRPGAYDYRSGYRAEEVIYVLL